MSQRVINAQLCPTLNNFGFRQIDQGCVNSEFEIAFDACFSSEVGDLLEGGNELWTAVGIAAVIDCVHTDENVGGAQHFSIT